MPRKATTPQPATEADIKRATSVEPAAIQEEYATVSSDLAHWGATRAEAARQEKRAELDTETWLANFVNDEREKAEVAGWRSPGVDGLKEKAKSRPQYREFKEAEIEASFAKDSAGAIVAAISAKKEMLVSLGADMRLENERDILIKQRNGGR
jgi:hypothetical protein